MNEQEKLVEQLAGKIICYHGTTPANAKSILKEGFRAGSYFAYRVEDSLAYGGPYLFAVAFSADHSMWHGEENGFQFHLREAMGPEEILWHTPIVLTLLAVERERCAEIAHKHWHQHQPYDEQFSSDQISATVLTAGTIRDEILALPPGVGALEEHDEMVRAEAVKPYITFLEHHETCPSGRHEGFDSCNCGLRALLQ